MATTMAAHTIRPAAFRREHPAGCWTPASARRAPAHCRTSASIPATWPGGSGPTLDTAYQEDGFARPVPPLAADLGGLAGLFAAVRAATAGAFLRRVLAAVRTAAPGTDVFVHADPGPLAAGSNPSYDPAVLLGPDGADGHHRGAPRPVTHAGDIIQRTRNAAGSGRRIVATLSAVTALGAVAGDLPAKARAVLAAGATDLRLYRAGLASGSDHAAMREVTRVSVG